MHTKIAPSLMNMGLLHVAEDLRTLDPYADYYHVDIIDGHYVRNMCLTPHFIAQIKQATDVPIEAHLYVEGV
ncbi:MAG: ribulose phosphate epimerase, partial [Atopobium sp.]|nr:ribulose phosphate epimerase [Atopobium sp.]